MGCSVAVLAGAAGAAWINHRSKSRTISSLLAKVQTAAEADKKLRENHSIELDGVQKRLGSLEADNAGHKKNHQKSDKAVTALLLMIQRAGQAEEHLRRIHGTEVDGLAQQVDSLQVENADLLATRNDALMRKVRVLAEDVARLEEKVIASNDAQEEAESKYQREVAAREVLQEDVASLTAKEASARASKRLYKQQSKETAEELRTAKEDLEEKSDALDTAENDIEVIRNKLNASQESVHSLEAANQQLEGRVASGRPDKGRILQLEEQLLLEQERAKSLELLNQSLSAKSTALRDALNSSTAREASLTIEKHTLTEQVESMKTDHANSQTSADKQAEELRLKFSELQGSNKLLASDVQALEGKVASLKKENANAKATLKLAVDGENRAIFEQQSLKAQVQQLTKANQMLTDQVASLTNTVAAAGTAQSPDKVSTEKPEDIATADGDKRSANAEGPTAEHTTEDGAAAEPAAANKDEDNAAVRKQAASKQTDRARAHQLELRITDKAAEYKGLLDIEPLDYAELGELCRGFRADQLDLVVAKT